MRQFLCNYEDISADLEKEDEIPRHVIFYSTITSQEICRIHLDAVDWMVFGDMDILARITDKERYQLLRCLDNVLSKQIGGKCLFTVPATYEREVQVLVNLQVKPSEQRKDYDFFMRLMVAEGQNPTMLAKFNRYADRRAQITEHYDIISDKSLLNQKAQEASDLLMCNAIWAREPDEIRQSYSAMAMTDRFSHPNITSYAAINKENGELHSLLRVFQAGNTYYMGDLVVKGDCRGKGLAIALIHRAFINLPATARIVLIAGDDDLIELYKKLGFDELTKRRPLEYPNGSRLMCTIIPIQQQLNLYYSKLPLPPYPVKDTIATPARVAPKNPPKPYAVNSPRSDR